MCEPLLRAELYPHFTLLGQALGSMVAALEAVIRCPSDIFIDTTGFAFTMPVFSWLAGTVCGAYIHFPTISSDMEDRVRDHNLNDVQMGTDYNNAETIRKSIWLTRGKLVYYAVFKWMYWLVGMEMNCKHVAVNSSWTSRHISFLWGRKPYLLYPPCPIAVNPKPGNKRENWILSIGQFRPEKNHEVICILNESEML